MFYSKKNTARKAAFSKSLFAFGIFALLVCNAATRLASGLARGLALTATAILCAFAKVLSIQSLNTLHMINPPNLFFFIIAHKMQ